jgi:nuclear transport factor 2 (NTF2) superfamily protein
VIEAFLARKWNRELDYRLIKEVWTSDLDGLAYVIEQMFCWLKDFRRVATRYDKLARNFLSAVASPLLSPGGAA